MVWCWFGVWETPGSRSTGGLWKSPMAKPWGGGGWKIPVPTPSPCSELQGLVLPLPQGELGESPSLEMCKNCVDVVLGSVGEWWELVGLGDPGGVFQPKWFHDCQCKGFTGTNQHWPIDIHYGRMWRWSFLEETLPDIITDRAGNRNGISWLPVQSATNRFLLLKEISWEVSGCFDILAVHFQCLLSCPFKSWTSKIPGWLWTVWSGFKVAELLRTFWKLK